MQSYLTEKKMNIKFHSRWWNKKKKKAQKNKHCKTYKYARDFIILSSVMCRDLDTACFIMTSCHVSRSSEHVRHSEACTGAKVISAMGVFGEYSPTG